ncbi:MAG: hypothetical protein RLZZ350_1409 [Verrucomicrobiota bacterium]|jgi:hypothetical protein
MSMMTSATTAIHARLGFQQPVSIGPLGPGKG